MECFLFGVGGCSRLRGKDEAFFLNVTPCTLVRHPRRNEGVLWGASRSHLQILYTQVYEPGSKLYIESGSP